MCHTYLTGIKQHSSDTIRNTVHKILNLNVEEKLHCIIIPQLLHIFHAI